MIVQFRLAIGPIYVSKRKLEKGDVLGDPSFWIDVVVVSTIVHARCNFSYSIVRLSHPICRRFVRSRQNPVRRRKRSSRSR